MMVSKSDLRFMSKAIDLSIENVKQGGGPFGAVIVKNGKIVASGVNRVTANNDPTAHAEVNAIRKACKKLKTFDLSDCVIYTSCEPCPMCLGAIYWAHIGHIYYGNTKDDAKKIGFDDSFIYSELEMRKEDRKLNTTQLLSDEAIQAFEKWDSFENKTKY
jgi:guanine deaminase